MEKLAMGERDENLWGRIRRLFFGEPQRRDPDFLDSHSHSHPNEHVHEHAEGDAHAHFHEHAHDHSHLHDHPHSSDGAQ